MDTFSGLNLGSWVLLDFYCITATKIINQGKPKRAPNLIHEKAEAVYIYLFVRDLAQHRLNVHAQTQRAYRNW
jgi:hypothetical protein